LYIESFEFMLVSKMVALQEVITILKVRTGKTISQNVLTDQIIIRKIIML